MREFLNPDDVVFTEDKFPQVNRPTFQVGEALAAIERQCGTNTAFTDGIPCRVLRPGGGWRNGKVRVSIEFIPDENHQNH